VRAATLLLAIFIAAISISCSKSTAKIPPFVPAATASPALPNAGARLSEAIGLAVRLGVLTQTQATCVFHDHPSILQEFIQDEGLGTAAIITDDVAKQMAEDLIRRNAVQLDRCLSSPGG
jgi:hypothetical protein